MLETAVGFINTLLWETVLIYGLVGAGIYFSFRLGLIQITHFTHAFGLLKISRQGGADGLSSFQVFCTSMAARVGAGNMAGVAVAISTGGPGAIFWMWLIAFLGMATSMVESTLAQVYKVKDQEGQFRGGPAYYMTKGLGQRWMGILFSLSLIVAFGLVFNAVQANTISGAVADVFSFDPLYIGIIISIASAFVIIGGLKKVAKVSEIIVPVMAVLYLLIAFIVVVLNIEKLPQVFMLIINSAFGWQEAASGGVAYAVAQAMKAGIARGLFSNEAGMGSAANVAASATPNPNHPASQGFIQMIGVFFDTLIICTATAAIILLAGEVSSSGDGIVLTINALESHVGSWGGFFVAGSILLFCFTSIIANYSYAETNILFLSNNNTLYLTPFRIAVVGMIMFGAVSKIDIVWALADASMGLMALINLIALILLSGLAVAVIKDYQVQHKSGKTPKFAAKDFPQLKGKVEKGIWDE
ncbi:alanine:cation symporter family protein [Psychrobium sp. MM17-31]|uniref:alanine/glycine:cation symporter family protein n=1 Tax=Psychrobium sp. MM17-31 TaxID=2917758 RepID=UPI001EF59107|nr:sodium:alanine symporter family protein [Psychrobium sp. MM17-31]MCG7531776.1 alanine:cation symporter family protein [Psychrobium sp. MM17-31]